MDAVNHQAIHSPASGPHRARRPTNGYLDVLALLSVVVAVLLIVFISTSDGVDYIHGFGKACDVVHDGWHFHMQCDSVSPPDALSSSPDYPSGSPSVTATRPAVPQVATPPQPEAPSPVTTAPASSPTAGGSATDQTPCADARINPLPETMRSWQAGKVFNFTITYSGSETGFVLGQEGTPSAGITLANTPAGQYWKGFSQSYPATGSPVAVTYTAPQSGNVTDPATLVNFYCIEAGTGTIYGQGEGGTGAVGAEAQSP